MFMVVSRWEANPGMEEAFLSQGSKLTSELKNEPGVEFFETIQSGREFITVHAYTDEQTYEQLVNDPAGPFVRMLAQTRLEELGRWVGSERGETLSQQTGPFGSYEFSA